MRLLHLLPSSLLFSLTTPSNAFEIPYFTTLSLPITLQDYFPPTFAANTSTQTHTVGDLRRRQGDQCPNNFHACSNLGAPGLCCANAAICTPDQHGNVACCPSNAVCTGLVSGAITSGTVNSDGGLVTSGPVTATSAGSSSGSNSPRGGGGATTTGGVVIQSNTPSSSASRAVVVGGNGNGNSGSSAGGKIEVPLLARAIQSVLNYLMF